MNSQTYIDNVSKYFHDDIGKLNRDAGHDNDDVDGGDVHEADETEQSVQRDLVCLRVLEKIARQVKQQTHSAALRRRLRGEP